MTSNDSLPTRSWERVTETCPNGGKHFWSNKNEKGEVECLFCRARMVGPR